MLFYLNTLSYAQLEYYCANDTDTTEVDMLFYLNTLSIALTPLCCMLIGETAYTN